MWIQCAARLRVTERAYYLFSYMTFRKTNEDWGPLNVISTRSKLCRSRSPGASRRLPMATVRRPSFLSRRGASYRFTLLSSTTRIAKPSQPSRKEGDKPVGVNVP
jgi:hypothetical protein